MLASGGGNCFHLQRNTTNNKQVDYKWFINKITPRLAEACISAFDHAPWWMLGQIAVGDGGCGTVLFNEGVIGWAKTTVAVCRRGTMILLHRRYTGAASLRRWHVRATPYRVWPYRKTSRYQAYAAGWSHYWSVHHFRIGHRCTYRCGSVWSLGRYRLFGMKCLKSTNELLKEYLETPGMSNLRSWLVRPVRHW